jgi:MFS transporter, DHA1 family, multidrug resistance protein
VVATWVRCNILNFLAYAIHATSYLVLPLYAIEVGASRGLLGFIGSLYGLASLVSSTTFGHLGDRLDRKKVLLTGFALSVLGFGAQLVATDPTTLLVARFAAGFAFGTIPPTLAAYVFDIQRPLGKFSSYNAMGWIFGSLTIVAVGLLSSFVFQDAGLEAARAWLVGDVGALRLPFLLSTGLAFIGLLVVFGLPSMHADLAKPALPWALIRRNANVYVPVFIRHVGATAVWIVFPLYILQLGGDLSLVGWLSVVNMVFQIMVLRNVERYKMAGNSRILLSTGLLLSALTLVLYAVAEDALQLLPIQALLGIAFGALWLGALKSIMEQNTERAGASGLLNGSFNLSNVIGPLAGGLLAQAIGLRLTMVIGAAFSLLAFVLHLVWRPPATHAVTEAPREPAPVAP